MEVATTHTAATANPGGSGGGAAGEVGGGGSGGGAVRSGGVLAPIVTPQADEPAHTRKKVHDFLNHHSGQGGRAGRDGVGKD